MKVCPRPSCPNLIPSTARYCDTHNREYEQRRGTSTQRGYDAKHRALRAKYQASMDAGDYYLCARCYEPIQLGEPWDLGHDDDDRTKHTGPEHAYRCNRAAGGRQGAAVRGAR